MNIVGKVIVIDMNATVKGQNGTYKGAEIVYKDEKGETKTKPFHSNALKFNAALKNGLENLSPGDEFTAVLEKKDDFWNWTSISKGTTNAGVSKPATDNTSKPAPSTYATAEERAQTQKYIIRQSSITAALKLAELNGSKKVDIKNVLQNATIFEDWVMGRGLPGEIDPDFIKDIEDDIPL